MSCRSHRGMDTSISRCVEPSFEAFCVRQRNRVQHQAQALWLRHQRRMKTMVLTTDNAALISRGLRQGFARGAKERAHD